MRLCPTDLQRGKPRDAYSADLLQDGSLSNAPNPRAWLTLNGAFLELVPIGLDAFA